MQIEELDRRAATRSDSSARRTRLRLRELCDEVLASYRAAKGHDPIAPTDREAATAVLGRVAPLAGRTR